jgi:hypothetical protein
LKAKRQKPEKKKTGKMITYALIAILSIFLIACFLWVSVLVNAFSGFLPQYEKVEIFSSHYNESIYMKKKVWGLLGDSQIRIISKSPIEKFDPNDSIDYVYHGPDGFYYKFENDTLFIYTDHKSAIPPHIKTKIAIVQIESEIGDLIANHEKMGIAKF